MRSLNPEWWRRIRGDRQSQCHTCFLEKHFDPSALRSLVVETYSRHGQDLFGPGFLEKVSNKLDTDKAMAKVTSNPTDNRKRPYEEDLTDLQ